MTSGGVYMEENMEAISHDVTITSRKKLVMSGIKDVSSFDEMQIIARSNVTIYLSAFPSLIR